MKLLVRCLMLLFLAGTIAGCGQSAVPYVSPTATPGPTGLNQQEKDAINGMLKPPGQPCIEVLEEFSLPDGSYVRQGQVFEKTIHLRLVTPVTGKLVRFYRAIINGEQTARPSWAPAVINFPGSQQQPTFFITPQLNAPTDFEGRAILFYAFGDEAGNFCGQPIKVAAIVVGK